MRDLHEQIAELEAEIETLRDAAERCRKVMFGAKAASAAGGLLLAIVVTGLLPIGRPLPFVLATAAILGGIALFGSTRTTREQIITTIQARQAQRDQMIGRLELHDLSDVT
jgi:hypothetical protein